MKREIKFRAWDRTENKYCNPVLNNVDFNDLFNLPFYDYQQYTGLKDKNGKDIYEGDVVYHHEHKKKCTIMYSENHICFIGKDKDGFYEYYMKMDEKSIEVIGNLYENPELLK